MTERVRDALIATNAQYPFLAYGTDWLAFAHLVIAVAFLGPLRDPVRNIWVIQWGVIACVGVIPLALIAGPIRGLPLGWTLIDLSFVVAVIPLAIAWRLTRRLERLRADAALVTVPYYSKPTQSGVLHHFRQLATQTELPLIVHNQPSHTAIDLTAATVAQLAEIPGVVGIADSSGDISRIDRWRALLPDRFGLYTSNDACALAFTIAGGHGCFSSAANIVPRLFQSMQHSAVFGSLAVSRSLGERLQPLFSALARESEPATVKHALSQVRSVRADVRLPLVGVADDTAAAIHAALTRVQCESTDRFAFHQTCQKRL